ncbi:MAG TPA: hypothetical protein VKR38_04250 [Usitatibacter sp.]|nr:hypothetical protein [Usitatibacter sp.]
MNTRPLLIAIAVSLSSTAAADPQSLELAKASARKVAESTCPLIRMLQKLAKAKPDSPEYDYLRTQIEEESKGLQQLKAEETEHLRTLGPKLTLKEGQELNEYIDGPLAKTCDTKF